MARTKEFDEDEVLGKAVNLFTCKGYNGTSAQDLVDCLGISRSSLYDTYGDKRALFIKAMNKYRDQVAAQMIHFIDSSSDVLQTIRHIFQHVLAESMQDKLEKGCFMVNSSIEMSAHDAEVATIVNAGMQDVEDALYRAIKKGQDAGQVSKAHSARALARFFFNTISGIRVAAKSGADKKVYDDIVKVALSTLK
jgi:TetR/AcrR family transcriptional repressor of nem operon